MAWLSGDKILRLGLGLVVGVWVARYLGPERFGALNYAIAILGILSPMVGLGLEAIVVRDLVRRPQDSNRIVGTSFGLQMAMGMSLYLLIVAGALLFGVGGEQGARLVVAIVGAGMLFQSSESLKFWFQATIQSKYAVFVENGAFLICAGVRIALILFEAPLQMFAGALLLEIFLGFVGNAFMYLRKTSHLGPRGFDPFVAKGLLRESWPLMLSGLAIMIYTRIDQIMIGRMIDGRTLGIYSAAVRISEVWYFVPMAINSSTLPTIIASRGADRGLFESRVRRLMLFMALLAIVVGVVGSLGSGVAIGLLYGKEYEGAAPILAVQIWAGVFMSLGVASNGWLIAEGLQRLSFYRTLAGAATNILLNLYLIPAFGAIGAASATVVSQCVASILFNAVDPRTRGLFRMQMSALRLSGLAEEITRLARKLRDARRASDGATKG